MRIRLETISLLILAQPITFAHPSSPSVPLLDTTNITNVAEVHGSFRAPCHLPWSRPILSDSESTTSSNNTTTTTETDNPISVHDTAKRQFHICKLIRHFTLRNSGYRPRQHRQLTAAAILTPDVIPVTKYYALAFTTPADGPPNIVQVTQGYEPYWTYGDSRRMLGVAQKVKPGEIVWNRDTRRWQGWIRPFKARFGAEPVNLWASFEQSRVPPVLEMEVAVYVFGE